MIQTIAGMAEWQSILLIGVFTTVYTASGGLMAVIYTDLLDPTQLILTWACLIGGSTISLMGLISDQVRDSAPVQHALTRGLPPNNPLARCSSGACCLVAVPSWRFAFRILQVQSFEACRSR